MTKWFSRRWLGLPATSLLVACGLFVCLLTPAAVQADYRTAFLNREFDHLQISEGDPGDGVLAPEIATRRASSNNSSYLAPDGSRLTPSTDLAPFGVWLHVPGLMLRPVFFWGPSLSPFYPADRPESNVSTSFRPGMPRLPNGEALYVLDERGCRHAP